MNFAEQLRLQRVKLLSDHYEATRNHYDALRKERNFVYNILIVFIAFSLLAAFDRESALALIGLLHENAEGESIALSLKPAYHVLHAVLELGIVVILATYWHRSVARKNVGGQLKLLGLELRKELALGPESVAFDREGEEGVVGQVGGYASLVFRSFVFVGLLLYIVQGFDVSIAYLNEGGGGDPISADAAEPSFWAGLITHPVAPLVVHSLFTLIVVMSYVISPRVGYRLGEKRRQRAKERGEQAPGADL